MIVAYSGGKDSKAILELSASTFSRVEAFSMHLVPGLECCEQPLREAERKYGIKILRLPHWNLSRYLRFSIYQQPNYRGQVAPDISIVDIEAHVREKFGLRWIIYGQRMDESLQRRGMLHQCSGVWTKFQRAYPLWDWSGREVLSYLKAKGIRAPGLTHGSQPSGFTGFAPRTMAWMKEHAPDDYRKLIKAFPFAEARLASWLVKQDRKLKQRSEEKTARAIAKAKAKAAEKALKLAAKDIEKGKGHGEEEGRSGDE